MQASRRIRLPLTIVAVGFLALTAASAQAQRAMGIVDLLNVPRLGDLQLSPDGREVLYTLGEADWKEAEAAIAKGLAEGARAGAAAPPAKPAAVARPSRDDGARDARDSRAQSPAAKRRRGVTPARAARPARGPR